jgi:predicted DNA-binding ribbon-helix-helix protein
LRSFSKADRRLQPHSACCQEVVADKLLTDRETVSTTASTGRTASRCIIYIVRRTQLYLDDHLWTALHARARSRKTTVSELVREAVRERYLGRRDEQMKAMREFVGIRKDRSEPLDAVEYVRGLRQGGRLERLHKK